jgi:hypothetical protein
MCKLCLLVQLECCQNAGWQDGENRRHDAVWVGHNSIGIARPDMVGELFPCMRLATIGGKVAASFPVCTISETGSWLAKQSEQRCARGVPGELETVHRPAVDDFDVVVLQHCQKIAPQLTEFGNPIRAQHR